MYTTLGLLNTRHDMVGPQLPASRPVPTNVATEFEPYCSVQRRTFSTMRS